MGNFLSYSAPEEPPTVVLVPPLIDSRERGRSRFCKSSYDRAFGQQNLRILFNDFLPVDKRCSFRFSPPEDPRISVVAKLRSPQPLTPSIPFSSSSKSKNYQRNLPPPPFPSDGPEGKITLRYQPQADVPWTFMDVKARAGDKGSTATLRGCYLSPSTNSAVFGILPLIANTPGDGAVSFENLRCGVRYTTPAFSTGVICSPARGVLHSMWAVGRSGGAIWGVQTEPNFNFNFNSTQGEGLRGGGGSFNGNGSDVGDDFAMIGAPPTASASSSSSSSGGMLREQLSSACKQNLSWGVAYQPEGQSAYGKGVFTASVELRRQRELVVSFLHHLATQRNVRNPFEKSDVIGITNYLDLAFQLATDLSPPPQPSSSSTTSTAPPPPTSTMRLAAAWQANKNLQIKARLGLDGVAAGILFKNWFNPAITFGISLSKPFTATHYSANGAAHRPFRLGITATVESYSALRYERSSEIQKMSGGRVTQRHIASEDDLAMHSGQGLLVSLDDVNNPEVLGQKGPSGADFL